MHVNSRPFKVQHQVVEGELETIEVGRPAGRQLPAGLWLHDCGRTGLCSHISSVDTYFVRFSFRVHDLNVDRESRSLKVDRRSRSPTENPQIFRSL